jgi:hypothetical protein
MPTDHIVTLLVAERDRLNRAIEALQGGATRRGRPPKKSAGAAHAASPAPAARRRKRKPLTAAQRKAQSERMKAFWAQQRKNKKG